MVVGSLGIDAVYTDQCQVYNLCLKREVVESRNALSIAFYSKYDHVIYELSSNVMSLSSVPAIAV